MEFFIDLFAIVGPDEGMLFSIERGTYRVMGRYETPTATDQLTSDGNRSLNADQQELINEQVLAHGRSSHLKHQRRGPDILLNDASVSRLHALLIFDNSGITLADLISTNGTKVNDTNARFFDLKLGDIIHIGKTKLQVNAG